MNQKMYEKATVMAVHRERYELLAENEKLFGRLKTVNFPDQCAYGERRDADRWHQGGGCPGTSYHNL